MIARGWERQLDRYRNPLFYEPGPISAARYRRWLAEQAISYVALPDAPLDYSGQGRGEAACGSPPLTRTAARSLALAPLAAVRRASPRAAGRAAGAPSERGHGLLRALAPSRRDVQGAAALHALLGALGRQAAASRSARGLDGGARAPGAGPCTSGSTSRSRASSTTAPAAAEHRLGLVAMVARVRELQARVLPHGWMDALRQVSLFGLAYLAYRLVRGSRRGRRQRGVRARPRSDLARARHARVRRAVDPDLGLGQPLRDGARELDLRQRPDLRDDRRAAVPLPAPQPQLLLRAQHVHDRDGDRARSATPSSRPRRRASSPSGASSTASRTSPA